MTINFSKGLLDTIGSEDCLSLAVFSPEVTFFLLFYLTLKKYNSNGHKIWYSKVNKYILKAKNPPKRHKI